MHSAGGTKLDVHFWVRGTHKPISGCCLASFSIKTRDANPIRDSTVPWHRRSMNEARAQGVTLCSPRQEKGNYKAGSAVSVRVTE